MAMGQGGITILVGTTKGAFLISGGSDRQGWTVKGPFCDGWPINHIIGDPATGVLRWRMARRRRVARRRLGRDLASCQAHKGFDRRLGGHQCATRSHDELDRAAAPIRGSVLADLVAGPCPWGALCRNQTGKAACESRRRQELGRSSRAARPPVCRQLESWRSRIGFAYDFV